MTISMYKVSGPAFTRGLSSLRTVLTKGAAHAAAKKIDESVFLDAGRSPRTSAAGAAGDHRNQLARRNR